MTFFKQLKAFGTKRIWHLTVVVNADETLNTLVQYQPIDPSDKFLTALTPKRFIGTAEKFDNDFFSRLHEHAPETEEFFQNAEEFKQSLKEQKGRLQERINNPGTPSPPKPPIKDAAARQFEELMKKVEDLAAAGKIGQAMMVLTKGTVHTRYAGQKEEKLKELKAKHGGFNLFDPPGEPATAGSTTAGEDPEENPLTGTGEGYLYENGHPEGSEEDPDPSDEGLESGTGEEEDPLD